MYSSSNYYFIVMSIIITLLLTACDEDNFEPELFGSISGIVLDAETSAPIENASITTGPPTNAIVTGSNGMFKLENIKIDEYSITAKKTGYKTGSVNVTVREDETANATILLEKSTTTNTLPNSPIDPTPLNYSIDQPTTLSLSWSASDPDGNDTLFYNVYLFESNALIPVVTAENIADTNLFVENLKYSTSYYWQVIVKDGEDESVNGELWSFSTKSFPDNRIVYATDIDGNYEIYSANKFDSSGVKLTSRPFRDWHPRLSPNLDKIAFSSDENVQPHIFTMNRDGSSIFKVTNLPIAGYHNYGIGFSWSPDGGRLLYSHYAKLYSIRSDGSDLQLVTTAPIDRHFRECEYSAQSDKITALSIGVNIFDSEILIMNSDGSGVQQIVGNLPGVVESPTFSIDGLNIMYTHDVSGYESSDGRQLDAHIFIISIDSLTATDISQNKPAGTNDLNPRFSSDGTQIIFTHTNNVTGSKKEIWEMDVDGSNRKRIIENGSMGDWR